MKRKLFISSSKEGLQIAEKIKEIITAECGDWLECIIWSEGKIFTLNKSFLDSLIIASRKFDYGIVIATADDIGIIRKEIKTIPRDNIIFEIGLFLGSLGLTRAFLIADEKCKLPSDYNGISIATFSENKSLRKDIDNIVLQLKSTRETYVLKTIPSVALAIGYFDSFIEKFAQSLMKEEYCMNIILPYNIDNINATTDYYKSKNPSEEISIFPDGARPRINRLLSNRLHYWDIPTTLTTLNRLINTIVHTTEIGKNPEKQEWIEHELRNFQGTLEMLINEKPYCKGKVFVKWME